MTVETVWSPVEDKNMNKDIKNSPVWKNCYHDDEVTDELRHKFQKWFEYVVKFEGLQPVQCTKTTQK
jgi:hypothetical protein